MSDEGEAPLHTDILEAVLARVPILDLVPASSVCKTWQAAVASTLRAPSARARPWLLVHLQSRRVPSKTTTHVYDPALHVWTRLPRMPHSPVGPIRSSHSILLYTLSTSKLSFAVDPLKHRWVHTSGDSMRVWRSDPVVAFGSGSEDDARLVVAGGTCGFDDDSLAVEMYDVKSRRWRSCESMPERFKNVAYATWLSVAVNQKVYVVEKSSGGSCCFDPETGKWGRTVDIRPTPAVFFSVIVFSSDRLILVGLVGEPTNVESLRIWEVDYESVEFREIGKMPPEMIEKLKRMSFAAETGLSSIDCTSSGDFLYIFNPSEPDFIICCDFSSGVCEWETIHNSIVNDRNRMDRFVFTCSPVGIGDLRAVLGSRKSDYPAN